MSKVCNSCNLNKPLSNFYKDSSLKCGYRGKCKECTNKVVDMYAPTITTDKNRKCNICKVNQPLLNFHKSKRSKGGYFITCKTCQNIKRTNRNKQPDTYIKEKEYRKKNIHKTRNRQKFRYNFDVSFRLRQVIRSRFKQAILISYKQTSVIDLLGCTIDFARQWLEYQFTDKMSWNNYGKYWHIDHVKPCCAFDLKHIEEQKACFNWKNIRPLSAKENIIKNGKVDLKIIAAHNDIITKYIQFH